MFAQSISLLLLLILISSSSYALRCGNKLIQRGDFEHKVIKYCGQPTSVHERTSYRKSGASSVFRKGKHGAHHQSRDVVEEIFISDWIYNFGSRRLMQRISFIDGTIVEIKTLNYGY